jgi:signal transduction histidine kinase
MLSLINGLIVTSPWQDQIARLTSIIEHPGTGLTGQSASDARALIDSLNKNILQLSQNLQITEERTRTMIGALPIGLLICSKAGKVEAANPASLKLFRCKNSEDLRGRDLSQLFRLNGASLDLTRDYLDKIDSPATEVLAQTYYGQTFPADILIRPFATPGAPRLLVVVEDVTSRREIERLKEEFVSMLSHDLRTPLTSLRLFMDMIASGRYEHDLKAMREKARGMEEESVRLLNMVNSLLDMHKLESHGLEMFFDIVPCAQLIRQSIQSIETVAQQRNISIRTMTVDKTLHVNADEHYIVQVLVNLLSNAIKFSTPGQHIHVQVEPEGSLVKFSVKDKGPGISEEFRQRMFNRFEQARVSDARIKGGTGLGLAICKAIVEQHGGLIGVESREGAGSSFWFTLQRVDLEV